MAETTTTRRLFSSTRQAMSQKLLPQHVLRGRKQPRRQQADERLFSVPFPVGRLHVLRGHLGLRHGVAGGEDSADHRYQVRDEGDRHRFPRGERQLLVHLRVVAVLRQPVRPDASLDLRVMKAEGGPPPSAGNAGLAIRHDPLPVDEPFLEERVQSQDHRGGEAARDGGKACLPDPRPVDLGQAVDRLRGEGRALVGDPVDRFVQRDAAEPEIGRQVDHRNAPGQERPRDRGRQGVRQGEESDVELRGQKIAPSSRRRRRQASP